jgi:hypothetical protein
MIAILEMVIQNFKMNLLMVYVGINKILAYITIMKFILPRGVLKIAIN